MTPLLRSAWRYVLDLPLLLDHLLRAAAVVAVGKFGRDRSLLGTLELAEVVVAPVVGVEEVAPGEAVADGRDDLF